MGSPQNPNGNSQGQPQGGGAQPQIAPVQVLSAIEEEATTGWCILTSMVLLRVQLDRQGATKEDRNALLDFWVENYVEENVDEWKKELNNPQNRMAAMQQGGTLEKLLNRLDRIPSELRQKFGTFLLNGADHPVESIKEAVDQFRALQNAAKRQMQPNEQ